MMGRNMKKFDVITIGVPMVEFTRTEVDIPLTEPGLFYGPIPAGDPGIALNACVRLGYKGSYVGVLGCDIYAKAFLNQMYSSGVDTSNFRYSKTLNTGMSMLTKFSDGRRDFMFTVPTSAAASIDVDDLDLDLINNVRWIHLSGFALSISEGAKRLHKKLIESVNDDVIIGFDPNYRKQVISLEDYLVASKEVFDRCNYFFPSRDEAILFSDDKSLSEEEFCLELSKHGKEVALKDSKYGAYAFSKGIQRFFPAYKVEEIDSTGAGDTFDGAVMAATLDGKNLFDAVQYANASAALSVTKVGMMDVAPTREEIDKFLRNNL